MAMNKKIKPEDVKKYGDDFLAKLKELKGKYDSMDDKTRQKIVAGVAGAVAVIAGVSKVKKMTKSKKKKSK
jgi:hypothetical protein